MKRSILSALGGAIGMPAFGPSHHAETIWAIATLVKGLPVMTPEEYRAGTPNAFTQQPRSA